ncbi:ABC transporter ATP-binding protein [Candidatus Poriferisocius sp.]|uniref:ABC transporter ATP-binding protein n=1 Tax=Candidatus Poriferisocius sp. TaxID=3101276 RepID=UPI003B01CDCC
MGSSIGLESASYHPPRTASPILSEACLEVGSGESVAVIGPSGSGKSTLLSILGGIESPTGGRVIATHEGESCDPCSLVSWIPQADTMLPRRSVLGNVLLVSNSRGRVRRADRSQVVRLLPVLGLGLSPRSPLRCLSGGERQRVAILRAVICRTPFIFADEPTGQLDLSTSQAVADVLLRCCSDYGQGLLVATHDLTLAERCDRVIEVCDGRIGERR